MLIFGIAAIGLALAVVSYVVLAPRPATADAVAAPEPRAGGELPSLLARLGALGARFTPSDFAQRLQRRLDLAGNPKGLRPDRVLAYKGLGLIAGGLLGLLFGSKGGGALLLLSTLLGAAFGLFLPDILVRNAGEKRQERLRLALPDAMDMLCVCVEAGLGFEAALGRVARNLEGPAAEEFTRVLQEMQFGRSRAQALRSLLERTTVPEARSFVSAVIQSGELGISIGDVLREQARELRVKRRQRAEERAQKLQVKLLMPLIACLLPAMFVVILGPAVIEITGFFHQAGR